MANSHPLVSFATSQDFFSSRSSIPHLENKLKWSLNSHLEFESDIDCDISASFALISHPATTVCKCKRGLMQSLCRLSVWQKSHGTGEAKSHAKYIATKSQPKYISHCNRYMLWKSLAIIRRLLSNQEYQVLSCFWWHFGWRICSSCKIHLNFLPWLHGHANADTLTHSNTNLCDAKQNVAKLLWVREDIRWKKSLTFGHCPN